MQISASLHVVDPHSSLIVSSAACGLLIHMVGRPTHPVDTYWLNALRPPKSNYEVILLCSNKRKGLSGMNAHAAESL